MSSNELIWPAIEAAKLLKAAKDHLHEVNSLVYQLNLRSDDYNDGLGIKMAQIFQSTMDSAT